MKFSQEEEELEDEQFKFLKAARVTKRDFYVKDILTESDSTIKEVCNDTVKK
jgi:hypothetical protein